ncbi:MAG: hypothetical protein CMI59_04820 [Parvibaculum sp.]|nr:hypothetical protein [Parvibaculum sp.]
MGPAGLSSEPVWEEGDRVAAQPDALVTEPEKDDRQRLLKPPLARPDRANAAPMRVEAPADVPVDAPADMPADQSVEKPADAAFLCLDAPKGMTVPVPAPFDRWMVRVCSAQGQALVPVMGVVWVAHGSSEAVSILALPPGQAPKPASDGFDPRYAYRFTGFVGQKVEGERRKGAAALLAQASGKAKAPPADEIWQLDAVSNIDATRYNIFFYLEGGEPTHMIACLNQCRAALFLDVLRGREANAAPAAGSLRR